MTFVVTKIKKGLPKIPKGHKRAFLWCERHDRVYHHHYLPHSLSNPLLTVPCGCDYRSLKTLPEREGMTRFYKQAMKVK